MWIKNEVEKFTKIYATTQHKNVLIVLYLHLIPIKLIRLCDPLKKNNFKKNYVLQTEIKFTRLSLIFFLGHTTNLKTNLIVLKWACDLS